MALSPVLVVATLLVIFAPLTIAQTISVLTPAPAPAPHFVNLTDLLSVAGPFSTFLNYLTQTKVIDTFQDQANNTVQGITIFVPKNTAFSSLKKPALSNITQDQLKTLLLYHAFPKYYSLSDFKNLSNANPMSTFAGGQNTLNVTDDSGVIRINSVWSNPKISSSVHSTYPVAVYQVDRVLIPEAIFGTPPPLPPAPAPSPVESKPPSDLAPSSTSLAPKSSAAESPKTGSASAVASFGVFGYLTCAISGVLVLAL